MRLITMKTAECEGLEPVGAALASASLARVASVEWIEGSHNLIAVVETARYGKKQVVCGAPNCRPGMLTVYVPAAPMVIQGVESDGMLASGSGARASTATTPALSSWIRRCYSHSTRVIEVDNKSLTHRPDLWGRRWHGARSCGHHALHRCAIPVKPIFSRKGRRLSGWRSKISRFVPRWRSALVFRECYGWSHRRCGSSIGCRPSARTRLTMSST